MTLLELKELIDAAVKEYGEHLFVVLPSHKCDKVHKVHIETCMDCTTCEEMISLEFIPE